MTNEFLSSIKLEDFDRGMGLTEPSAWISEELTRLSLRSGFLSFAMIAKSGVLQGGGLKTLSFSSLSAFSKRGGSVREPSPIR